MSKIHISTALFGGDNDLNLILPPQKNCEHEITISCYTDLNTPPRVKSLHPRTKGKIPKILEWMSIDADYYIWLDASFTITSKNFINDLLLLLGDNDICLYNHAERNSITDEINTVELWMSQPNGDWIRNKYAGEPMREQVSSYLSDTSFVDNHLFELGFFIYSKNLIKNRDYNLMTDWFFHNCLWSIQDQLSLPYLIHKHKTKYTTFIDGNIYNNQFTIFNKK